MAATATQKRPLVEQEKPTDKRQKELREAAERVYRVYGTDLASFYRDAHGDARKEEEKKKR